MTFDDWWGAYPTQEDYEANCRDAYQAGAASRNAEIESLRQQLAAAQEEVTLDEQRVADLMSQVGELSAQLAESQKQVTLLRDALEWYGEEAKAISKNMKSKNDMAVLASVNVLALDAGKRAALAATEPKP